MQDNKHDLHVEFTKAQYSASKDGNNWQHYGLETSFKTIELHY